MIAQPTDFHVVKEIIMARHEPKVIPFLTAPPT